MSRAACKVPINDLVCSDMEVLSRRIATFEKLLARPGFAELSADEQAYYFDNAIRFDKEASAALDHAIDLYETLIDKLANSIE